MNITGIRLLGLHTLDFQLFGATMSNRYVLKDVDGLGPPISNLYTSENAVLGVTYKGRRPNNRELVFRVSLSPQNILGQTSSDLRNELYGLLTPNLDDLITVQLLEAGLPVAYTTGWVDKIEPALFSKDPEVQITMFCAEPYFSAIAPVSAPVPGTSNWIMPILNEGSAPAGFKFSVSWLTDHHTLAFSEEPGGPAYFQVGNFVNIIFEIDDILTINTIPGQRSVILTRDGVDTNYLPNIYPNVSRWPMLKGGLNVFNLYPFGNFVIDEIEYTPQYWGV